MKKQIESMYVFRGKNDREKIWVKNQEVSSDNYNLSLMGKVKYISQRDEKCPVLSFPYFYNPGQVAYYDMYICGGYCFKQDASIVKPIGYLSSYFGTAVTDVSFAGYLVHPQIRVCGLIAIGKDIYMSNESRRYDKIGKKDDYIPTNIISIFFYKNHHVVITNQNKAYVANVTFDGLKPRIQVSQEEESFGDAVKFLNPTCCSILLFNQKYKYIFVNKSGGYIEIDEVKSPIVKKSGEIELDFEQFQSTIGTHFEYLIFNDTDNSSVALEKRQTKIFDTACNYIEKSYNEKRQLISLDNYNSAWNELLLGVVNNYVNSIKYSYLWNSSSSKYASIALKAVGILEEVKKDISDVSGLAFQEEYLFSDYKVIKDMDGDERIIFDNVQTKSGVDKPSNIVLNQVMAYSQSGQPLWIAGAETADKNEYRTYSQSFYSKESPDLLIASFDAVEYNAEGKYSAGYTGFEPYEEVNIKGNTLVTPHFVINGGTPSIRTPWGSQSIYFLEGGTVTLSDNVYINLQSKIKYVVTFVLLEHNKLMWEIKTIFINPGDLETSRQIINVNLETYIAAILFKSADCESNIYLYNPRTHKRYGHIDNNFIPTFSVFDSKTQRKWFSYKLKINENNNERFIGNEIIMEEMQMFGYALFGGFNRNIGFQKKKNPHNTIVQFSFRDNGQFLEYGKNYALAIRKSFMLLGQGNVSLELHAIKTIGVKISTNQLIIYQDEIYDTLIFDDVLEEEFDWILAIYNDIILVFINGKLIYSSILNINIFISLTIYEKEIIFSKTRKTLLIENFDIIMNYYDYLGRIVQTQTLKIMYDFLSRIVSSMYFYNASNQLVAQTLKGAYPYDKQTKLNNTDKILEYRDNFANIDWKNIVSDDTRGVLEGELASYYKEGEGQFLCITNMDYKYPYTYCEYETGGLLRLERMCQPGADGFKNKEDVYFHDSDTYDKIIKGFTPFDADYDSSVGTENINGQTIELYDRRAFQYNGTDFLMSFNSSMNEQEIIMSKINSKIEKDTVFSQNLVVNSDSYYQNINLNDKMTSRYNCAYNRIQVYWGVDTGYNIQINDAAGRARIILHDAEISKKMCTYFKYDRRSRITEMGRVTFAKGITFEKILERVLDPEFPYEKSQESTYIKIADYEYDLEGYGYSLGYLCRMSMRGFKHDIEYVYDQFGRINKQSAHFVNCRMEEEFVRDNLFNLLQIKYIRERGQSLTITYSYVGNNVDVIEGIKEGGKNITILKSKEYDIYNRLLIYQDCNELVMYNKYDVLGRLISMGKGEPEHREISVNKNYTTNALKYQRLLSLEYQPDKYFQEFKYDDFLRLKSAGESFSSIFDIEYDKNGNIRSYSDVAGKNLISYAGICKVSETPNAKYMYNDQGMVIQKNWDDKKIEINMDYEFQSKVQTINQKNKNNEIVAVMDFQYSADARLVFSLYSAPLAGIMYSETDTYSEDGRILQSRFLNGQEYNYLTYIYLGNRLVAVIEGEEDFYGISQDKTKTLFGYTLKNEFKPMKYDAWGMPKENVKVRYLYKGMKYLEQWNLYLNEGSLYDPSIGITFTPILGLESYTPYRIIDNVPFA